MALLKKLIFAPLFLLAFALLIYELKPLFISYDFIFSLSLDTITKLLTFLTLPLIIAPLVILASFLFVFFTSFALDWKIIAPVGIVASIMPMVFLDPNIGLILTVGTLISLLLIYITLESSLKTYITFNANSILGPKIKSLSTLLILIISLVCFLSIYKSVPANGFQISDSVINQIPKPSIAQPQTQPQIGNEEIDFLKKNPELLKQVGLDPGILDSLTGQSLDASDNLLDNSFNQLFKDQMQSFLTLINPYIRFVPMVLAVILFLNLETLAFIINLLIHPLLWLIFLILEKTGFTKYQIEQREVKKLVV